MYLLLLFIRETYQHQRTPEENVLPIWQRTLFFIHYESILKEYLFLFSFWKKEQSSVRARRLFFFSYHFDVLFVSYRNISIEQIIYEHFVDRRKKEMEQKKKASKKLKDCLARVYPSSFDDSWLIIVNVIEQLFFSMSVAMGGEAAANRILKYALAIVTYSLE